jgi:hypothetical protein
MIGPGVHNDFSAFSRALEYLVLVAAFAGLGGVWAEIACNDQSLFRRTLREVADMAAPSRVRSYGIVDGAISAAPPNSNLARRAAA